MQRDKRRKQAANGESEGIDYVRCRICGDHRRVLSARHLSKHGIDREAYMEKYCLSPDELIAKDFRRIQSSRRGYQPHGKREWIAAMKQLYEANGNLSLKHLQTRYRHLYEQGRWIFGDSDKALRAAGLKPECVRLRELLNREKVVNHIRTVRARKLPLNAKYVLHNHPGTFSAGRRLFGSWIKALATSEITVPKNTNLGRLGTLRALRDALDAGTSRDKMPQELKLQAEYYFGSLPKAITALRTERKITSGWSTRKIIVLICRLHRAKENLSYAAAPRNHPALVSAAEAYFGSWGKALQAAGIKPSCIWPDQTTQVKKAVVENMIIDDDTLKQLLLINDELLQLCKRLNEQRELKISSRLIPLTDKLTHILIQAGKNKLQ